MCKPTAFLIAASLAAVSPVVAQDSGATADPPPIRHHIAVDPIRLLALQPNFRYTYALSSGSRVFAQAVVITPQRDVYSYDNFPREVEYLGRASVGTEANFYLGYQQRLAPIFEWGRLYVEGGVNLLLQGEPSDEYEEFSRRDLPTIIESRLPASPGVFLGFGGTYPLRGGWTLEARMGIQYNRTVQEVTLSNGQFYRSEINDFQGPTTTLLSVGKRF